MSVLLSVNAPKSVAFGQLLTMVTKSSVKPVFTRTVKHIEKIVARSIYTWIAQTFVRFWN